MRAGFVVTYLVCLAILWGFALTASAADQGSEASAQGSAIESFCARQEKICFNVCSVDFHFDRLECTVECRRGSANCADSGCFSWPHAYQSIAFRQGGQKCLQ